MKTTMLDTNLLPNAWITWDTTKGTFWVDCTTNEKSEIKPDVNFSWSNKNDIYVKSNSRPYYAYVKYHEDIEMLEVAAATFDTRRTAPSHEWKYAGNKYFIDKQKNVFDAEGRQCYDRFNPYPDHYAYDFKNCLAILYRLSTHSNAIKEFHKFLGKETYTVGSGRVVEAKYLWHIQEWFIRKQKDKASKGKEQSLVEKLTTIPLSDMYAISGKYPVKTMNIATHGYTYTRTATGLIYFEKVDDNWSVLRILKRECGNVKEVERIYINDNGKTRICTPSENNWITQKRHREWSSYDYWFANKEEAMQKSKRLKYILPLFNDDEAKLKLCLYNALRFVEIEQLMKLGYCKFAKELANSETIKADLKNKFGDCYNEKEKSLWHKAGLNKHQFDMYVKAHNNTRSYNLTKTLKQLREFFGDDFIHLDNETFDDFFNAFLEINRVVYRGFNYHVERYHLDNKKFMKNLVRLGKKHGNTVYTIMSDTMNMYGGLNVNTHPEVNWYFDGYSDLTRAHDAIMELKRVQDEERQAIYNAQLAERRKKEEEKRKKVDKERKNWEYEDDNYIIRLPKDGTEIIAEGNKQRICIGGYVSDHSMGRTSLFFLRKKNKPDKPFYAIEVRNNAVIQIHGFGNRWLGNNPEAIPTVVRWLRKNGISCSDHILTCTATGYGSTNTHCAMPKID